jgi:transcriptional regulator with XRE-family HTH domain
VSRKAQALCIKVIALLQEERIRRKLSKYFVAQESGLSPQMIAYVERGMRNPTLETVLRMSEAMKVDLAKIITHARKELSKTAK